MVAPAGTTLFVSSSTAPCTLPVDESTTATVASEPSVVVIVRDADDASCVGRSTSAWLPDGAAAVPIVPGASDAMATLPSIKTSTGLVMALTTRSDGAPVVQHVGRVVSLLQATATASTAIEARAGMRMNGNYPAWRDGVPQLLGPHLSATVLPPPPPIHQRFRDTCPSTWVL